MAHGSVILLAAWLAHNRYWHSQREQHEKEFTSHFATHPFKPNLIPF
jgi:hypothetical protein